MAKYDRNKPEPRQPRGTGRHFWIESYWEDGEACSVIFCDVLGKRTRVAAFYSLYDETNGNTILTARVQAERYERTLRLGDEGRKAQQKFNPTQS